MSTTNDTRVTVSLAERSYDIVVGEGLLARLPQLLAPQLASKRVILISDDQVGRLYAEHALAALRAGGLHAELITVAAGESAKSFSVLEWLVDAILALTPDRKTTILALGGGVVGDLAGFVASILLRGLPFIQIPTSLLAQVDSSVGGKTAINTQAGKNLVGSFYQPKLVLADTDTLATLPRRQMRAGYGEILKYGLIMDADFYRWCLANADPILAADAGALQTAVTKCCQMKAQIVGADEREGGRRALLNFGHTFGHALEAETGYSSKLLHGEAVALGMLMACRLSQRLGLIDGALEQELARHLAQVGLPFTLRSVKQTWNARAIATHFASDKKAQGGSLTFVVLDALGSARVMHGVDPALALAVVESFL